MIKKTFENRITQESEKTIRELKSLWIKILIRGTLITHQMDYSL